MKEIIQENIQTIRHESGFNQTQFAKMFRISRSALGAYEEGRCTPPIEILLAMSQHFDINLEIFVTRKLCDVWKENATNAMRLKSCRSSLKIREARKAANAIVKNAQMLLSKLEQES
jgi:DNA-binding XRE family transcriptional regulator